MVSVESLLNAWDEFKKRGKRKKRDVQVFELRLEDNLFRLHRDLKNKRYKHGQYVGFYIRDPKVRHIHKAGVRDRIVHHALFKYINPNSNRPLLLIRIRQESIRERTKEWSVSRFLRRKYSRRTGNASFLNAIFGNSFQPLITKS